MRTVSPTATATPTISPTPSGLCTGDCNDDLEVTVSEIIRGVNIALGMLTLDACPVFDTNGDGEVTINELVQAVNAALTGCERGTGLLLEEGDLSPFLGGLP